MIGQKNLTQSLKILKSVQNYMFCGLEYCKYYNFVYYLVIDDVFPQLPCGNIMEIKNLPGDISDDLLTYMHITSNFLLQEFVVFSESICYVQKMMNDGNCEIHLFGPKGCGKSYTAAVLFLMLQDRKPCLYLTQRSFTYPNYFLAFLNH